MKGGSIACDPWGGGQRESFLKKICGGGGHNEWCVSTPPYEPPTIGMVRERIFIFDSVGKYGKLYGRRKKYSPNFFLDNNRGLLMIRSNELAGGPSDVFRY